MAEGDHNQGIHQVWHSGGGCLCCTLWKEVQAVSRYYQGKSHSSLLFLQTILYFSLQYLEKRGVTNIKRENFSFSTKLIVGDFLRPSGQVHENGEEAYQRYTEHEMGEEIDKVRRENGWKPRKRNKPSNSTSSRKSNGTLPLSLENMGGTVQEQYQFLQRLQAEAVERDKRKREEQEQVKLQREAMR